MKKILFLIVLASCADNHAEKEAAPPSTVDSLTMRQIDTGPLTDTDDHNKPSTEGTVLDAPASSRTSTPGPSPKESGAFH